MKTVFTVLGLILSGVILTSHASAYELNCPVGQKFLEFQVTRDAGCRSGAALLFSNDGRCLSENSTFIPRKVGRYAACIRLFSGQVAGSYVASIESSLEGQDGTLVLE